MKVRLLVAAVVALALVAILRPGARAAAETDKGLQLARRGNTAGAEQAFAHALSLDSGNVKALYNDAIALARLGRAPEAASRFEAFLKARPDDALGWFQLARLDLKLGKPEESLHALQRAVDGGFADYDLLTGDGTFRQLYPDVRFVSLEMLVARRAGVDPHNGVLAGLSAEHPAAYGGEPLENRVRIPGLRLASECQNANPTNPTATCGTP